MTTKTISLFLVIIMIALSIPFTPLSADASTHRIISANDLYYAYGAGTDLACELIEADGGYVHCVASPGSYGDNQLKYTFSHPELVLYELPYVVVEYRTDSQNKFVDLLHGSNWLNTGISHITDGAWHKLYFNVNDIKDNPSGTLAAPGVKGTSIVLKPWKSHSKVLGSRQYYDIRYVGFFKNQKDAEAFVYESKTHKNEIELKALENVPFYDADANKINEYLEKANAQKQAIINSPTDVSFSGTAYYVSAKGDDSNDGLTPATAFKTVAKVSGARFLKPGDAVLFERTSVFRCTDTLNTVEGVTYSAYGSGAKPKLIGAIDASFESMWKETDIKNVYVFSQIIDDIPGDLHNDVGQIIFDGGKAWGIKLQNGHWIGTNSNGLEMIATGTPSVKGPEGVRHDLEYWYDHESGKLYLYSKDGNPAKRFTTVDICTNITAIRFTSNNVIDNLDIYGYGRHGLAGGGENITVQNCTLSFIGGGIHWQGSPTRLGNAVQIYGTLAKNFTIKNCYASQIYDCGFTVQYQDNSKGQDVIFENIEMCGNITEYANTGLEVWLVNHKKYNNPATFAIKNMRLHHNYTLFSGYGWSQQRTNKDSNLFYGDPNETNTLYENCSVDNNVGMFSSKWLNYLRYPGTGNYNFNSNIYFQHENKLYGGVTSNPELGLGLVGEYPYTKDTLSRLLATGIEPNSVFYSVKADYKVPAYSVKNISFSDISSEHWAYGAVRASVMRGLFNGVSATEFAPNASMTRAMAATVLARLANDDRQTEKAAFADANEKAWYSNALNFAYTYELVDKNKPMFRPDDAITREELADMLYRFAYSSYKCEMIKDPALTFSDADKVSPEYASGIAFATANGIITGYEDKSIRPKNTATRAEVATMIGRFLNLYASLESDFSRLAAQSESRVFAGEELKNILNVSSGDKELGAGELATLKISPKPAGQGDPYPQISILERGLGVGFEKLPYIKLRFKTTPSSLVFKYSVIIICFLLLQ
ncbi:MAG: S-layer homology domain-containing protein [Clostridia bacterium]|nr:S-layer homology domain-containing protein [Clostridia bacterium]